MPTSDDGYNAWKKKFDASLSTPNNHLTMVGRTFDVLRRGGCDPQELYSTLWGYSRRQTDREGLRRKNENVNRSARQSEDLASLLNKVAAGFTALKESREDEFAAGLANVLWDEDFQNAVHFRSGLLKVLARHWSRSFTTKKLLAHNFLLAYLCGYVKAVTNRPHYRQISLLLQAAWAAHGQSIDWNADMVQERLRRIPGTVKTLAVQNALTNSKKPTPKPPKK